MSELGGPASSLRSVENTHESAELRGHPKGTLLWDVGIIPDAQITPGGVSIAVGTSGNSNRATRTLRSQLAEIGYRPADITFLALSHSHGDHIANANDYAHSTWLVQKPERDLMFSEQAQKGAMAAAAAAACIWQRSTDSPRFPTSGALRGFEGRPRADLPWGHLANQRADLG